MEYFKPPLYEATPPKDPFATALTAPALDLESDDEDEWEYEYSTTETETYYLTLDLTTPQVKPARKAKPRGGRNKKLKWVNPAASKNFQSMEDRGQGETSQPGGEMDGENEDEEDLYNFEDDEEDGGQEDGMGKEPNGTSKRNGQVGMPDSEQEPPSHVQILELHSENPIISYGGKMYSGEWVENIGTEMLFTQHTPEDPLPALRTLPGNVDLLAASSARIITTSLVPRVQKEEKKKRRRGREKGFRVPSGKVKGLKVNVGVGSSTTRKNQARFLETVINTKKNMNEKDLVTVNAASRKGIDKWTQHADKERKAKRKRLMRLIAQGGEEGEDAEEDLAELDLEEANLAKRKAEDELGKSPAKKRKGRAAGRPSHKIYEVLQETPGPSCPPINGSPRGGRSLNDEDMEGSEMGSDEEDEFDYEDGESDEGDDPSQNDVGMRYFEEEEDAEEDNDENEGDYDSDESEQYGEFVDDGLHDEDAPGEDDDTRYV